MAIGTTAALIGSSVLGAAAQGSAARKAAKSQENAANQDIAFQKETRDIVRGDLAHYRTGGQDAYNAYRYEMGLGPAPVFGAATPAVEVVPGSGAMAGLPGNAFGGMDGRGGGMMPWGRAEDRPRPGMPQGSATADRFRVNGQMFNTREEAEAYARANSTAGTPYQGFQKSQDYLFGLNQGLDSIQGSAAARGGLFSGATLQALNTFGQDYASQRRGEYLNRLAGLADTGMSAANMSGNASMAAAGGVSNALAARGNAAAAGAIGVGNAINSGIGNALGAWQYQKSIGAI